MSWCHVKMELKDSFSFFMILILLESLGHEMSKRIQWQNVIQTNVLEHDMVRVSGSWFMGTLIFHFYSCCLICHCLCNLRWCPWTRSVKGNSWRTEEVPLLCFILTLIQLHEAFDLLEAFCRRSRSRSQRLSQVTMKWVITCRCFLKSKSILSCITFEPSSLLSLLFETVRRRDFPHQSQNRTLLPIIHSQSKEYFLKILLYF